MSGIQIPAPLWRRLAAAVYDGLLLIGLWMAALVVETLLRGTFDLPRNWYVLRALLFGIGLAFFGWFWTHGGQTLGMRVWRLSLRHRDGHAVNWLTAATRYALMLLAWSVALSPLTAAIPPLRQHWGSAYAVGGLILLALGLIATRLDPLRRAPHDLLSGTVVDYRIN